MSGPVFPITEAVSLDHLASQPDENSVPPMPMEKGQLVIHLPDRKGGFLCCQEAGEFERHEPWLDEGGLAGVPLHRLIEGPARS